MSVSIGDVVVYPPHGVTQYKGSTEFEDIVGISIPACATLGDMMVARGSISIPNGQLGKHYRLPATKEEARAALRILKQRAAPPKGSWIHRTIEQRFQAGTTESIAEILRDIYPGPEKTINAFSAIGEYYHKSLQWLTLELVSSLSKTEAEAETLILETLNGRLAKHQAHLAGIMRAPSY